MTQITVTLRDFPVKAIVNAEGTIFVPKNTIPDSDRTILEDNAGYRYLRSLNPENKNYFEFKKL